MYCNCFKSILVGRNLLHHVESVFWGPEIQLADWKRMSPESTFFGQKTCQPQGFFSFFFVVPQTLAAVFISCFAAASFVPESAGMRGGDPRTLNGVGLIYCRCFWTILEIALFDGPFESFWHPMTWYILILVCVIFVLICFCVWGIWSP